MDDVRVNWDISGAIKDDRWVVEHFKMTPEIGGMKIWFSDLFNGNEEMSKSRIVSVRGRLANGALPFSEGYCKRRGDVM